MENNVKVGMPQIREYAAAIPSNTNL